MTEDEMVGRHHPFNGPELEQTPGVGDGQGSLVCGSPWGLQRVGCNLATEQQQHLDCNGCCVTEHHDEDTKLYTKKGQIAVYITHTPKT